MKTKTKTKINNNDHPILGILVLVVMLVTIWPVLNFSTPKEAHAESSCPAPVPSTHMRIRTGSPTGPIIGSYDNEGWNENVFPEGTGTVASLSVTSGTVLYFDDWTEGVEGTNRAPGSQHYISGGLTITSPTDLAGYYPTGFSVTKRQYAKGFTNPINSSIFIRVEAQNSCWGGFEDGVSWIHLTVNVSGGPPAPTTREAFNNLAIVKNPSVSLLVNGATSVNVSAGATANFSWTTDSVNIGDSCIASNNNSDSTWTGAKLGQASYTPPASPPPGGGSQTVGPFSNNGSFIYSVYCVGLNGVASVASTVTVNVGNPPTYTCTATPGTQQVYVGSTGAATINVTPLNGYSNPITFTGPDLGKNAPIVDVDTKAQNPPYSSGTSVLISTYAGTSPGTYSIVFTGTDGVSCPPITFTVLNPTPDAEIRCDGQLTSCTKSAGQSATITWSSAYVTSCDVSHNPPAVDWTGTSGSQSSGSLASSRTYYLNCSGPYGNVVRSVAVNVIGAIDAPTNVQGNNGICDQITVTWGAPASGSSPTNYKIYRRDQGDTGPGSLLYTTPTNSQFSYTDTTGNIGSFYQYGVSALFGSTESPTTWAIAIEVTACEAKFDGSYKKIVGAGTAVPSFSRCSGTAGAYDLGTNQLFESDDIVYFEICVINSGNIDLTNVTVTEDLPEDQNIENVQFVNAENNCATGSGAGPYTIGNMPSTNPDTGCSILVRATISNPGGPASSLNYFTNYAQLASNEVSFRVNSPPTVFIIGGDVPDRTETPR